jgi:hypothetical protein
VERAGSERQGTLLPRMDGPYRVLAVPDDFSVQLADPVTGEPAFSGDRIAVARCAVFAFPSDAVANPIEFGLVPDRLLVGQLVVVDVAGQARKRDLRVARIASEPEDGQVTLELYAVPVSERNGPWGNRCWATESYGVESFPTARVLCYAELSADRAFTDRCMEALRLTGVTL